MRHFEYAHVIRRKFSALLDTLGTEQLNVIPEGFNNNIVWHLGHLVVSTPLLCYVRTGVSTGKHIDLVESYRNGTKPERYIGAEEIKWLHERLLSSLEEIEKDYREGLFREIQPYSTHTFGVELQNIEDVFQCCTLHDTVHWGNVMSMRKLV